MKIEGTQLISVEDKDIIGGHFSCPDGITHINSGAFSKRTSLTSISLCEGLKEIGNFAFEGCTGLTNVSLPNGIENIGDFAFVDCTGLISLTFPKELTHLTGHSIFKGCIRLSNIKLPDELVELGGSGIFWNCSSLMNIHLPKKLKKIGANTFNGCTSLTSIIIPKEVQRLEDFAFYGCLGLSSIIMLPEKFDYVAKSAFDGIYSEIFNRSNLKSIIINNKNENNIDEIHFHKQLGNEVLKLSSYLKWQFTVNEALSSKLNNRDVCGLIINQAISNGLNFFNKKNEIQLNPANSYQNSR